MNAEALLGTVLGTSTLQQLIGQGGMGAVYLAQQSRPRRQVAVKVLMPATSLKPHQLSAFLERFRRETDAAASLEHPNIMPVYEYGERGGLAYLVMPYISGGTLRDVMEQEGQMAFADAVNYLEQMAAALDFAHARGVIHRDIKPANMLLTPDGRLLLTDFGLVKLLSDNQSEQMRLTGAGAPVGTPDYMSPEQVIGAEVDGRADQYSLGVVLFQMLTGSTPFQGETPMQIASQQLHMQPPRPRLLRTDLPEAAEMVLLRAMSKRPDERFNSAQEFAFAFRTALVQPSAQPTFSQGRGGLLSGSGARKNTLFDPQWQNTNSVPAFGAAQMNMAASPPGAPTASFSSEADTNTVMPRPGGAGLLSRTGMFPRIGENTGTFPAAEAGSTNAPGLFSTGQVATPTGAQQAMFGQKGLLGTSTGSQQAFPGKGILPDTQQDTSAQPMGLQSSLFAQSSTLQQNFSASNLQQLSPAQSTTNALSLLSPEQKTNNTVKLTGPVKVVQVPVAPGQYVTGLLPVQKDAAEQPSDLPLKKVSTTRKAVLLLLTLLILAGAVGSGVVFLRSHNNGAKPTPQSSGTASTQSNPTATFLAQATATATANTVFFDPLNQNIHFFPISTSGAKQYVFKDNAYHITNAGSEGVAVVVQQSFTQTTLGYQITMQEIKGDDTSPNNTFGMILRFTERTDKGKTIDTFYTFEILNEQGAAQYSFFKYDNSRTDPWGKPLWTAKPGKELHVGHGDKAVNTIKVFADGSSFTFYVNGQKVGTHKDGSLKSGSMGMLVNLKGTEVAFSNMLITKN